MNIPNNEVKQSQMLGAHLKNLLSRLDLEVIYDDGSVIVEVKSDQDSRYIEALVSKAMESYSNYDRVGDGGQEGGYWLNVRGSNSSHYGVEL